MDIKTIAAILAGIFRSPAAAPSVAPAVPAPVAPALNLKAFYDTIRPSIPLTAQNVQGFDFVLTRGASYKVSRNHLAYILATAYWETAKTMQPVREAFWLDKPDVARGDRIRAANATIKRYFPYYGRGYVQLTWDYNYAKATKYFREVLKIDVDFVKNPDLVMNPEYSLLILFVGMKEGWFTGKSLFDYIDDLDEPDAEDLREFANARRIVNGTDKQIEIGKLGLIFERGLKAAGYNG